jgi:hypothetical protein
LLDKADLVARALVELIGLGYHPITFGGDVVGPDLPSIQIAPGRRTAQAIVREEAEYYKHEALDGIPKRWGRLLNPPRGVRVIFVERVSS